MKIQLNLTDQKTAREFMNWADENGFAANYRRHIPKIGYLIEFEIEIEDEQQAAWIILMWSGK